jgi:hypothetical protein
MLLNSDFVLKRPLRALFLMVIVLAILLSVGITAASAQFRGFKFDDYSGAEFAKDSADLDVGYVPTPIVIVHKILKMGSVKPNEFLIDLGSGDGRIVITAAKKYGARALGIDLNAKLVELSKKYALEEGVARQTNFVVQDIFTTDIRKADVVTMYLLPEVNLKLRSKLIKELRPGARIVSYNYHLGDWRPDKTILIDKFTADDDAIIYFWVVPAKVTGKWHWRLELRGEDQDFNLQLNQSFQDISGAVRNRGRKWPIFKPALVGNRISFSLVSEAAGRIVRQDYKGIIKGKVIVGAVELSGAIVKEQMSWKALGE